MWSTPDGTSLPQNSIPAKPQKVTLPTGAKVSPIPGSTLGPGKGNNGRGGGEGRLTSRWTPYKSK